MRCALRPRYAFCALRLSIFISARRLTRGARATQRLLTRTREVPQIENVAVRVNEDVENHPVGPTTPDF